MGLETKLNPLMHNQGDDIMSVDDKLDSTLETVESLLAQGIGGKKFPILANAVREARAKIVGKARVEEQPKPAKNPPSIKTTKPGPLEDKTKAKASKSSETQTNKP